MLQPIDARHLGLVDRFGRDWAEGMLEWTALTGAERVAVTDAIGRCYEQAGLARPARVDWVRSPLAGRLLAADLARRYAPLATRIRATATLVRNAAGSTFGGLLAYGCGAALNCAAVALVLLLALPGDAVWPRVVALAGQVRRERFLTWLTLVATSAVFMPGFVFLLLVVLRQL